MRLRIECGASVSLRIEASILGKGAHDAKLHILERQGKPLPKVAEAMRAHQLPTEAAGEMVSSGLPQNADRRSISHKSREPAGRIEKTQAIFGCFFKSRNIGCELA